MTHLESVNEDTAIVNFTGYEAVTATLSPATQNVTSAITASFMLLVTNTGNLASWYQLSAVLTPLDAPPSAEYRLFLPLIRKAETGARWSANVTFGANAGLVALETNRVYVPPHMTAGVLATVPPGLSGHYRLDVHAQSVAGPAQAAATAYLTVATDHQHQLYLPLLRR